MNNFLKKKRVPDQREDCARDVRTISRLLRSFQGSFCFSSPELRRATALFFQLCPCGYVPDPEGRQARRRTNPAPLWGVAENSLRF